VKWPFPVKLMRDSRAKTAPFRFYGPTCDSIDAAQGPFDLPADIQEGDYIEIGMLGAYGVAMATRFNGFGDTELAITQDAPWASMFAAPEAQAESTVVQMSSAKRKPKRK